MVAAGVQDLMGVLVAISLPQFQSDDQSLNMMQNRWAAIINPVLTNPVVAGSLLRNVALVVGANVINHKLGRNLQGWFFTRIRAAAQVYDTQDVNTMQNLTLNLTSDANVVVDIYVF